MDMSLFIMMEKTATPSMRITAPSNFSVVDLGLKSPKPMVDRVVMA
jgi:hypothetical protein